MLYVLLGGVLAHAAHWSEAMLLAAATGEPWRKISLNPVDRPRVLMISPERADTALADGLLRHLGAVVRIESSIEKAEHVLEIWRPQTLVLSFGSGTLIEWLADLRQRPGNAEIPILALGDGNADEEARAALDAGADAYLARPVRITLLVAQVQSLLHRAERWEHQVVGDKATLCVDPIAHRVWVNGREIFLTRRLFRILHYLALHPDHTFSSADMSTMLTQGKGLLQPNSVTAQMHRLRMALETVSAAHWIETVHGFGYRLTLPKSHREEEIPGLPDTAHEDISP
ncbi:response regulator transcription factor [Acidithiobacillus sp.]